MKLELITPEAVFFSGLVNQVDIPGMEGEFGVLPGHSDLISTMNAGVIKIYAGKDEVKRVLVAGGIAEINAGSCTVLAGRIMDLNGVARADADKTLAKAREMMDAAMDDEGKYEAIQNINFAEALVSALS
jgi:F-type H+-transporting ATPase subunit epsilon